MIQLIQPDTTVTDGPGWCLRFTQKVWGAPAKYNSAWDAWLATQFKHNVNESIPNNLSVIVWFSHYGTYGSPPTYDNWGHVVSFITGRGYLSSPGGNVTSGQRWFGTIGEVERFFNAKYVGWSEDINGLRVVDVSQPVIDEGFEQDMIIVRDVSRNRGFAIGQQYIYAYPYINYAEAAATRINPGKSFIDVRREDATVDVFVTAYGIPKNIWEGLEPGKVWSVVSTAPASGGVTEAQVEALLKKQTYKAV